MEFCYLKEKIMKRVIILVLFGFWAIISYSQIAQVGLGFAQSYMKDCQSNYMIDINISLANVYFSVGTTLKSAKECEYGRGVLTDREQQI